MTITQAIFVVIAFIIMNAICYSEGKSDGVNEYRQELKEKIERKLKDE